MDLAKKLRRRGNSLKRRKERLALERQGHEEIRATLESTRQHLDNILDELKTAQEEILGHKTKLDEISHLLTKDKLTGILNSNAATEEIHKVYKNAQRAAEARKQKATAKGKEEDSITFMVTVFYDIDRFKLYNDRLGYFACGNTVIKGVAEALQSALRTEDFLFRNGGEEFVSYFHLPIKKHHLKKL